MLYDKAKVLVKAGDGGDGCMSFRREAHVPRGGPDGGDGGRGGDVELLCDGSLRDLQSFKRKSQYKADRGGHGEGNMRHGADGETLTIGVAPGTQVRSFDGSYYDLTVPGQRVTIAKAGRGGRGNKQFAHATRQAPRFAERGAPGEEGWIELELKLLADVGLVGLPNAGKSSLLKRMTRADPKIGSYPFTTLEPQLGTIQYEDRQLILADIPGLIEGASEGAGLGHDFLAHIERTRLIVHVLDLAPLDGSDALENHNVIESELAQHDPRLARLPRVLALSKSDLVTQEDAEVARKEWEERLDGTPVIVTSSATGDGLETLKAELFRHIELETPVDLGSSHQSSDDNLAEYKVFKPAAGRGYAIERVGDSAFKISGRRVENLVERFDVDNDDALAYIELTLRKIGVIAELQEAGFTAGDEVTIGDVIFELDAEG